MREVVKITTILLLIVMLGCLYGCKIGGEPEKNESLQVYYAYLEGYLNDGELIGKMDIPISRDSDPLHLALTRIMEDPEAEELVSAFPENVRIISYTPINDSSISVSLNLGYWEMSHIDRSIAKACLVLTLCQLNEVNTVSIYVENSLIDSELSIEDIILPNYELNEYEKQLTLYYSDESNSFLEGEKHILTIGQDRNLVEYVIDELVRGPKNEKLQKTLPEGTRILSIQVKKNLCVVDLSKKFLDNSPETAAGERVAIYSIVNSLTELTGIDAVQILVEGEKIDKYYLISLLEPLTKNEDIIWQGTPEIGESVLNVYMGTGEGNLVALPVIANVNYSVSMEQNVVEKMLSLKNEYGYRSLMPVGTKLNSIYISDGICYIDLSPEFFVEGKNLRVNLAVKALAAAVIDTGNSDYVTISVEGEIIESMIEKDESIIIY